MRRGKTRTLDVTMRRRAAFRSMALLALGSFAPFSAQAQKPRKVFRVGVVSGSASSIFPLVAYALRTNLALLGYVPDNDVLIEARYAEANAQLPGLVDEVFAKGIDVLVADGAPAVASALARKSSVPIVGLWITGAADAPRVAPDAGLTGLMWPRFNTGRLEILRSLLPHAARVAAVRNATAPDEWADVEQAMRSAGVEALALDLRERDDAQTVRDGVKASGADAVLIPDATPRAVVAKLQSLFPGSPIIFPQGYYARPPFVALAAFGVDGTRANERVAAAVVRVLKGAKPAAMPVELFDRPQLTINRRLAKEMGLTIPVSLLKRADQVVE
jgi:putative tryptophan/tyrosine transport system substrate-binding protein